jgi:hypothetical protein
MPGQGGHGTDCDATHAQAYEFTDTLIMVLKKNERQISFLWVPSSSPASAVMTAS